MICYDAKDEMMVRLFVEQAKTDQSLVCHLVECDLYRIFLELCEDMAITDAWRKQRALKRFMKSCKRIFRFRGLQKKSWSIRRNRECLKLLG